MHFCVIGYDGTDRKAAERRDAARPLHRKLAAKLEAEKHLICGGAIVNFEGKSIGSVLLMDFPSKEEFNNWYSKEPFVKMGVWTRISVEEFKITVAQPLS